MAPTHNELLALVKRLAAVYTVDTDQYAVIRLVADAQRLLAQEAR